MSRKKIWLIRVLFFIGILSLFYYLSWWFIDASHRSPILILLFIAALLYSGIQVVFNWVLYLLAEHPVSPQILPHDLTVDIFITAYFEPYEMVERTLIAACSVRGEHKTWLLDDGDDPELARLAERLGAGYLTRSNKEYAKAGNLNAALGKTEGDIVVIFDVDHVPALSFLEKSLGFFTDPEMGFVQVMVTFDNAGDSWVAKAAVETSLEYYNPTSLGAYGIGGATLMGSNALIRRKALESIGGYQPGLAEDLATSIALHAKGWKSAYVAEPLAPGMAPPSFVAWFTQQLKWSRGVFELFVTAFPRLFHELTWGQRLSYIVRMTKYWIGPAIAFHLFATIYILTFATPQARAAFHSYLIHLTPLIFCDALLRYVSLRVWRHASIQYSSLLRAVLLVYSTWPIYLQAWLMALIRLPLSFHPTPKSKSGKLHPLWLLPQFSIVFFLLVGTGYTVRVVGHPPSMLLVYAIVQGVLQMVILVRWMHSDILGR
ncbi:MAG TPA: glycosyltransferase [Anaerolineales bacterium]|nr:glycosyltransferase [Anaerolineales bacterium]